MFKCVQERKRKRREKKKCVNRSEEKMISAVRRGTSGVRGIDRGEKYEILRIGTMHARTHIW